MYYDNESMSLGRKSHGNNESMNLSISCLGIFDQTSESYFEMCKELGIDKRHFNFINTKISTIVTIMYTTYYISFMKNILLCLRFFVVLTCFGLKNDPTKSLTKGQITNKKSLVSPMVSHMVVLNQYQIITIATVKERHVIEFKFSRRLEASQC